MTWPSAIYEIKQQVFLLNKELEKTKNRDLTIALRILLENDQRLVFVVIFIRKTSLFRYKDAFKIFLQLNDDEVYDFIERRYLYREDWIRSPKYILQLMKLNRIGLIHYNYNGFERISSHTLINSKYRFRPLLVQNVLTYSSKEKNILK